MGRKSAGFELDVPLKETVEKGASAILDYFGRVDILINNAGINHQQSIILIMSYPTP